MVGKLVDKDVPSSLEKIGNEKKLKNELLGSESNNVQKIA